MSDIKDKFDIEKDRVKGKFNEAMGKATDDEAQELKGKLQQKKADIKEDIEEAKEKVTRKINDLLDKDDEK
jgi:uncharacterized protein YjbJ (UPF0337 family)